MPISTQTIATPPKFIFTFSHLVKVFSIGKGILMVSAFSLYIESWTSRSRHRMRSRQAIIVSPFTYTILESTTESTTLTSAIRS